MIYYILLMHMHQSLYYNLLYTCILHVVVNTTSPIICSCSFNGICCSRSSSSISSISSSSYVSNSSSFIESLGVKIMTISIVAMQINTTNRSDCSWDIQDLIKCIRRKMNLSKKNMSTFNVRSSSSLCFFILL